MIIDNTKNSALYLGANKRFEKAFAFIVFWSRCHRSEMRQRDFLDGKKEYPSFKQSERDRKKVVPLAPSKKLSKNQKNFQKTYWQKKGFVI